MVVTNSIFCDIAKEAAKIYTERTKDKNLLGNVEDEIYKVLPDIMQAMQNLGWTINSNQGTKP